jgi:hypothetical protein
VTEAVASCVNVTLIGNVRVSGMILGSETSTVQRTLLTAVPDGDTGRGGEEKELNMLLRLRGRGSCCAMDGRLALLPPSRAVAGLGDEEGRVARNDMALISASRTGCCSFPPLPSSPRG